MPQMAAWPLRQQPLVRSPLKNGLVIVELCSVATDTIADVTVRKSSRNEIVTFRKKQSV